MGLSDIIHGCDGQQITAVFVTIISALDINPFAHVIIVAAVMVVVVVTVAVATNKIVTAVTIHFIKAHLGKTFAKETKKS